MKKNELNVKTLIDWFELDVVNKDVLKEIQNITSPAIYRAGLELAGFNTGYKTQRNIVTLGTKENNWLNDRSKEQKEQALSNLIKQTNSPLIILSNGFKSEENIKMLMEKCGSTTALVKSHLHVADISTIISPFLSIEFASEKTVHGSLVIVNGMGVMITGASGIGKSEAVIELIQNGHSFVTDDSVVIKRVGNKFMGSPAKITEGLLEARGIGLIDIKYIYGVKVVKPESQISLVVQLSDYNDKTIEFDRLGNMEEKYSILDYFIPMIKIPVKEGRSASALIEAAVNVFIAKMNGFDPLQRISDSISNGDKK